MTKDTIRDYFTLRTFWGQTAAHALRLAKDRHAAEDAGITFIWESEDERPEDVFGEASYYECSNCGTLRYSKGNGACCRNPHVTFDDTGVYYDPTAEHYSCLAQGPHDEILASLGMIDSPFSRYGTESYAWFIECELSGEVLAELDKIVATSDDYDHEDTLA